MAWASEHGMEFGVSTKNKALHIMDRRRYRQPSLSFGGETMHHISMAYLEFLNRVPLKNL